MINTLESQRIWIHGVVHSIQRQSLDFGRTVKNVPVYLWAFGSLWRFSRPTKHAPVNVLVMSNGRWQSICLFPTSLDESLLFWDAEQDVEAIPNPSTSLTWGWNYDEQGAIVLTPPHFLTDPRVLGNQDALSALYRFYILYMKVAAQFDNCITLAMGWVEFAYVTWATPRELAMLFRWGYLESVGDESQFYLARFNPSH